MIEREAVELNAISMGKAGNPPVLFVHGMAGSAGLWVLEYSFKMMKEYHILAFDQRGHGLSPASPHGYRLNDHADDLERVRRRFVDGPVTVVGYSYGGHIATQWAIRYPHQAAGLVVIDTPPLPVSPADIDDMIDGLSAVLGGDFSPTGGFIDPLKDSLRQDIQKRRRQIVNAKARIDALKKTSFKQDVLSDQAFDDADFQGIDCPTGLIYSSRGGHQAYAERQKSFIKNCSLSVVEGDHDFVIKNANGVRNALLTFLRILPGSHPVSQI